MNTTFLRSHRIFVLAGVLVVVACSRASGPRMSTPAAPVALTATIKPVRAGAEQVQHVEVRTELRGNLDQSTRPLSFRVPVVYASVQGIAARTDSLKVRDASGDVPLTIEDDPVARGGFPYWRHFRAQRPVTPPVVLTYRMRPGTPRTGPQFDLYAHGGGVSFGGMALFVVPENVPNADIRVRYDLSDLARGSIAASTNGDGDFTMVSSPEQLVQAYYMVGPAGVYRAKSSGFTGYWLGTPQFEPRRVLEWTERSYDYQRGFHNDTSTREYRVFIRAAQNAGGGTALRTSFMLGTNPGNADTTNEGPRGTLAHEMGHMWIGGLANSGGGAGATWFAEGMNVHYTRLLLLRSGLEPVDAYVRSINSTARAYYTNPFRNASHDSLSRVGFSAGVAGGSAQNVPYNRGSLFWADVDARLRAATGGRRTLDSVILPLFDKRRRGEQLTQQILVDAIASEVGASFRDHFEAVIIRGETIVPQSNAFGPCFERRTTTFTVQDRQVEGYEWVRVPSISDERCKEW